MKRFPELFIREYSHFIIDGIGHLATHFDLYFKGKYSYGDRFRAVFRTLANLTRFADSSVHNITTKVAILDEQSMDSYMQVDNRNKAVSYIHDPELSDETNIEEYRKFLSKTSYSKRQLHIHPNFNHNQMQIYGHNFTSIFKNVVYFEKHRKNKTLFNVCQFKGCTLELSRYGTMDTSYISTSDSVYDPKAEKYRFKVK